MNRRKFLHGIGLAGMAFLLSRCASTGVTTGRPAQKGPPPHAPAHGYRRKNRHGLVMKFDSNLGVYVMMNYPMHYYWNRTYYRRSENQWETSRRIDKGWKSIERHKLPKGLQDR